MKVAQLFKQCFSEYSTASLVTDNNLDAAIIVSVKLNFIGRFSMSLFVEYICRY